MIGRRTLAGLACALLPSEATLVMAGLACGVAAVMRIGADVTGWAYLSSVASTFLAIPIWVLIAGSMNQLSVRVVQARRDAVAWWRSR